MNGLFVGLGDLFLSSGKPASTPEVQALVGQGAQGHEGLPAYLSGIAAGTPPKRRATWHMGYSLVMVSNDATLFGKAAAEMVRASR